MTLAGGDPDSLSLRRYLDCAYALLVEEYQRLGKDLMTATEELKDYRSPAPDVPVSTAAKSEADVARQNEESLRELQRMMGGL